MRPNWLPLIAAGDGPVLPQRWTGPFVHVSDLTAEELADWIPPVDDGNFRGELGRLRRPGLSVAAATARVGVAEPDPGEACPAVSALRVAAGRFDGPADSGEEPHEQEEHHD